MLTRTDQTQPNIHEVEYNYLTNHHYRQIQKTSNLYHLPKIWANTVKLWR